MDGLDLKPAMSQSVRRNALLKHAATLCALLALALLVLALGLAVLGRWTGGARVPAVAIGNLLGGFAMPSLPLWTKLAHNLGAALLLATTVGLLRPHAVAKEPK